MPRSDHMIINRAQSRDFQLIQYPVKKDRQFLLFCEHFKVTKLQNSPNVQLSCPKGTGSKSRFHAVHFPMTNFAHNKHLYNVNLIIMTRFSPQNRAKAFVATNREKLIATTTLLMNKMSSGGLAALVYDQIYCLNKRKKM